MPGLETKDLALAYEKKVVVEGVSCTLPSGKITSLVGPNGSGKSTVLKGLARILAPHKGVALLEGKEIHKEPTRAVARLLAILPQVPRAPAGLTVRELVRFGRFPYRRALRGLSESDEQAVQRAIDRVELSELAERPLHQLSGGQAQRVWIAMTLAQETRYLLLDEPTTYLDIAYQLEVFQLLRRLNRSEGLTVVMATQDLNLAARYSDWMIALRKGRLVAEGSPEEFMSEEVLERVFDIKVDLIQVPSSGVRVFVPREVGGFDG